MLVTCFFLPLTSKSPGSSLWFARVWRGHITLMPWSSMTDSRCSEFYKIRSAGPYCGYLSTMSMSVDCSGWTYSISALWAPWIPCCCSVHYMNAVSWCIKWNVSQCCWIYINLGKEPLENVWKRRKSVTAHGFLLVREPPLDPCPHHYIQSVLLNSCPSPQAEKVVSQFSAIFCSFREEILSTSNKTATIATSTLPP